MGRRGYEFSKLEHFQMDDCCLTDLPLEWFRLRQDRTGVSLPSKMKTFIIDQKHPENEGNARFEYDHSSRTNLVLPRGVSFCDIFCKLVKLDLCHVRLNSSYRSIIYPALLRSS